MGSGTRETFKGGDSLERNGSKHVTAYNSPSQGLHATFRSDGRPQKISKDIPAANGRPAAHMEISRGPSNQLRVETTQRLPSGHEAHLLSFGNHREIRLVDPKRPGIETRVVYHGNQAQTREYRTMRYSYRSGPGNFGIVSYYRPLPLVTFAPAYYGWLVAPAPWGAPVRYTVANWGWSGQPWFTVYGAGFQPYVQYHTPEEWLTDYIIAAQLQQMYLDSQQPAAASPGVDPDSEPITSGSAPPPEIPADVKEDMKLDVHAELEREKGAGSSDQPPGNDTPEALLDHSFLVYTAPIEAALSTKQTCDLAEGDMLRHVPDDGLDPNNPKVNGSPTVKVTVKFGHANSQHPGLCAEGNAVYVQLADLQEIHNHKVQLLAPGEEKMQSDAKFSSKRPPKAKPQQEPVPNLSPEDSAQLADLRKQLDQQSTDASSTDQQVTAVASKSS